MQGSLSSWVMVIFNYIQPHTRRRAQETFIFLVALGRQCTCPRLYRHALTTCGVSFSSCFIVWHLEIKLRLGMWQSDIKALAEGTSRSDALLPRITEWKCQSLDIQVDLGIKEGCPLECPASSVSPWSLR